MRNEPDDVVVHQIGPRTVAIVRRSGSFDAIPAAIETLLAWLSERGLEASGTPGTRYYDDPRTVSEEAYEWEAFVEVREPDAATEVHPSADDEVEIRTLPATEVAATVHRGPYETVSESYDRIQSWAEARGWELSGPAEELYLGEPSGPPDGQLTEVRMPVTRHDGTNDRTRD